MVHRNSANGDTKAHHCDDSLHQTSNKGAVVALVAVVAALKHQIYHQVLVPFNSIMLNQKAVSEVFSTQKRMSDIHLHHHELLNHNKHHHSHYHHFANYLFVV